MFLFLLLAVPAWLYAVISFYPKPSRGWRGLLIPLLGGLAGGVIALVFTLGLLTRTPFQAEAGPAYAWAWYRGPGWMMTILAAALVLYYNFKPTSYSRIRELACWLSGAVFVYIIWYAITPEPGFNGYRLFVAPMVFLGSMGAVVWLADRGLRIDGWLSYVFYVLAVGVPSIFTFLPVMYVLLPEIITICASLLLTAGSLVLIYLDSRGRLS